MRKRDAQEILLRQTVDKEGALSSWAQRFNTVIGEKAVRLTQMARDAIEWGITFRASGPC